MFQQDKLVLGISIVSFCFLHNPLALAGNFNGGVPSPDAVRGKWKLTQNVWDSANDLHFTLHNKEPGIAITGHQGNVSNFPNTVSMQGRDVKVWSDGAEIPLGGMVTVDSTLFLTAKNTIHIKDIFWTKNGVPRKAGPDWGWKIDDPVPGSGGIGFKHLFVLDNDDLTESLLVKNLCFFPTKDFYSDLNDVPFECPSDPEIPVEILLNPEESFSYPIMTGESLIGGHIYMTFSLEKVTVSPVSDTSTANIVTSDFITIFNGDHPVISVVPEPTSTLSLLFLGILGAGVTLKRKVKRTHSTEKEPANVS